MIMAIHQTELKSFTKDVKKLQKRFSSLKDDIKGFVKTLPNLLEPSREDNGGLICIREKSKVRIYKAKKFRCKALKGKGCRSGIRLIFAYIEQPKRVNLIEIYYKEKDKTIANEKRIASYLKSLKPQSQRFQVTSQRLENEETAS